MIYGEQAVEPVPSITVGQWPALREKVRDASIQEAAARDSALRRDISSRVRLLEKATEDTADRVLREGTKLEEALTALAAALDRSDLDVAEWDALDAKADQLRAHFGRLVAKAQHTRHRLEDPLATLDDMERRFPPLRRPVPPYLRA